MDKLIITALRGKTAAVLFKDGHAAQIDFEPEAAEEETGVIFVGKVKNISRNVLIHGVIQNWMDMIFLSSILIRK